MTNGNHSYWVTAENAGTDTALVYFRACVKASDIPQILRVSADSRYKLYINGRFIQYGPCKGDNKQWYADEIPVREYLTEGENTLAFAVYWPGTDPWNSNHSLFTAGKPALFAEGIDPSLWRYRINTAVRFPAEEQSFAPLHIHEDATTNPLLHMWNLPGYDDSSWDAANAVSEDALPARLHSENLKPRIIPFMRRTPHDFDLPETIIPPHSSKDLVLDAGEEMCAFLRLAVSGGAGSTVELLQSECYVTDSGKADRTDSVHGYLKGYADRYVVQGLPDEVYEPYWFRTFRYLKLHIETAAEPLRMCSLTYEETGYPLDVRTEVTTSDKSFFGIWDISLRTLRRCMHETYFDCPFYEQLQYEMDTRSEALYTYSVAADDRLARQAIDDFSRSQRADGLLNASYPNKNSNVIPGFSIYYIMMLYDHMMYFGDSELVRKYLPTAKRSLDFFAEHLNADGIVAKVGGENGKAPVWSFIDWAEQWMPTTGMPSAGLYGPITMESLLYLMGLEHAAILADYIGETALADDWRARTRTLKQCIRRSCMDDGMITDGPGRGELSQHCQVFGVLTGVLSPEDGRRALLRSIQDNAEKARITQCTVSMCYYLFRALEKTDLYEYTDRYWDAWREMVQNHCTTCVESKAHSRSECHAWGSLALYELPSVVLGVRPAAPGYSKIEISPHPGTLSFASGTVHTPRGDVRVEWKKGEKGLELNIRADTDAPVRTVLK